MELTLTFTIQEQHNKNKKKEKNNRKIKDNIVVVLFCVMTLYRQTYPHK